MASAYCQRMRSLLTLLEREQAIGWFSSVAVMLTSDGRMRASSRVTTPVPAAVSSILRDASAAARSAILRSWGAEVHRHQMAVVDSGE